MWSRLLWIGVFVFLIGTSAEATCASSPILYQSLDPIEANYSYFYTRGFSPALDGSSVSPRFDARFWIIGEGNEIAGIGIDNGSYPGLEGAFPDAYQGWVRAYDGYPVSVRGTWLEDPRIDGCPFSANPSGALCMAFLFSDQGADGNGYFALVSKAADTNLNYLIDLPNNGSYTLAPLSRPAIVNSVRVDSFHVDLELEPPTQLGLGLFQDPLCDEALVGYRIYQFEVPRGELPPSDRDRALWSRLTTGSSSVQDNSTVRASCGQDSDLYLAYSLLFESGYETQFVSENSARVECGPNVAEPSPLRKRPADRLQLAFRP